MKHNTKIPPREDIDEAQSSSHTLVFEQLEGDTDAQSVQLH
jgi:hypothetical protein